MSSSVNAWPTSPSPGESLVPRAKDTSTSGQPAALAVGQVSLWVASIATAAADTEKIETPTDPRLTYRFIGPA
ncbi:Uncharacterised protein [Mycobacteroides abscessus subsp. bolletii]|nr:Uncharacterised protein [Mycobacteroides abscessus subsp. bolletii]